jgi:small subunit ribosomal protein S16
VGATKRPAYRVIAIDKRRSRDGRALEILGYYDPLTEPATVQLDSTRIQAWIGKGAQPSDTVVKLMRQAERQATDANAAAEKPKRATRASTPKPSKKARAKASAPAAEPEVPAEAPTPDAPEADAPAIESASPAATEPAAPEAPEPAASDDAAKAEA